ncbi:hypothetical protein QOT17_014849 [Balamuthia mandrillaris]
MAKSAHLTVPELKEKLSKQGISFDKRAKKADLQALYENATNKGKEKEDAPKDCKWTLHQDSAEEVQPYYENDSVHNELAQLQWSALTERFVKRTEMVELQTITMKANACDAGGINNMLSMLLAEVPEDMQLNPQNKEYLCLGSNTRCTILIEREKGLMMWLAKIIPLNQDGLLPSLPVLKKPCTVAASVVCLDTTVVPVLSETSNPFNAKTVERTIY